MKKKNNLGYNYYRDMISDSIEPLTGDALQKEAAKATAREMFAGFVKTEERNATVFKAYADVMIKRGLFYDSDILDADFVKGGNVLFTGDGVPYYNAKNKEFLTI